MKKIIALIILSILLIPAVCFSWSRTNKHLYPRYGGLTGGGTGAVDYITGASLMEFDRVIAYDTSGNTTYFYNVINTGTTTENSPFIITPDSHQAGGSGSGTSVWRLSGISGDTIFGKTFVIDTTTFESSDVVNWNTAYGWGDHGAQGYVTTSEAGVTVYGTDGSVVSGASNIWVVLVPGDVTGGTSTTVVSDGKGGATLYVGGYSSGDTALLAGVTVEGSAGTPFYVNPTNTTSDVRAIAVVPQSAIGGIEWDGLLIDGSTLDPSAVDAEIHGAHIDLSGIATTNSPHIEGLHIQVPAQSTALHSDGEIHQDYDATTGSAGDKFAAHHIRVDVEGATGGEIDAVDVSISGTKAAGVDVVALDTHTGVKVIKQTIAGSAGYISAVSVFITQTGGGVTVHATDEFASTSSDTPFMVADNDQVLIGATNIADLVDINVVLDTAATKDMFLTFECSSANTSWVTFIASDGTNGMVQSGIIESALPGTMAQQVITSNGGAVSSPYLYWIRITRTRATGAATGPTEDQIQTFSSGGEIYQWDEDGRVTAYALTALAGVTTDALESGTSTYLAGTLNIAPGLIDEGDIDYSSGTSIASAVTKTGVFSISNPQDYGGGSASSPFLIGHFPAEVYPDGVFIHTLKVRNTADGSQSSAVVFSEHNGGVSVALVDTLTTSANIWVKDSAVSGAVIEADNDLFAEALSGISGLAGTYVFFPR